MSFLGEAMKVSGNLIATVKEVSEEKRSSLDAACASISKSKSRSDDESASSATY